LGRLRLRADVPSGAGLLDAGAHPHARAISLSDRARGDRQEHATVQQPRSRGAALYQPGVAALAAQARPHRSELQELKIQKSRVVSPSTTSALSESKTPPNPGRRFYVRCSVG